MAIDSKDFESDSARHWYHAHSLASLPVYRVLEYVTRCGNSLGPILDNLTKTKEIAYRSFGPAALVGAAAFLSQHTSLPFIGLLSLGGLFALEGTRMALHLLAYANQKRKYIHVRGEAVETRCLNPRIMTWNILGFPAGMNYICGGCIPFRDRFQQIAHIVTQENPEIVIFQECLLDASVSEMIIHEFKGKYAHFFIHNGPNLWGTESGLLVMTKCPVIDYSFTSFENNNWTMNRGFITLTIQSHPDLPPFAVIGTHMEAGSSKADAMKRKEQLHQIYTAAQKLDRVDSAILAGDLNIDAAKDQERQDLDQVLIHVHATGTATCTNELNKLRNPHDPSPPEEWVDQISAIKQPNASRFSLQELRIIEVYKNVQNEVDSRVALSDHNPLIATFSCH